MSENLEKNNKEVRDKWIAKSLGIHYNTLIKERFFVATDKDSVNLIATFAPSTDTKLLARCNGFDGTNVFRLPNN